MSSFRPSLWVLGLLVVFNLAPTSHAAANLTVEDILVLDADGRELRIIPQDGFVTIRAVLNNTGDTSTNGTLVVSFTIRGIDEAYLKDDTVRRNDVVSPGNQTNIDYRWAPGGRVLGNHSVSVNVQGSTTSFTGFFVVAETGVPAGSMVERFIDHYWFFGVFIVAVMLFFAVVAARKG